MPFTRWRLEPAALGHDPLAACVIQSFVLGFIAVLVDRQQHRFRNLRALLRMCAWCKRIHVERDTWEPVEAYIHRRAQAELTHGVCPDCYASYEASLEITPRQAASADRMRAVR